MKVFISVDLEGISGVCHEAQATMGTPEYQQAIDLMHGDVLAAVEGCRDGGADEIVVCDAHDFQRNLRAERMPEGVVLASGQPNSMCMLHGLDASFSAALFVGYHAMAGTRAAVLDHTYTYDVFRVRIDEYLEIGEVGINAGLAGRFGVPVLFVSGDAAVAAEAAELLPGVETAAVKTATGRTSALLQPPAMAHAAIRRGVARALRSQAAPAPVDFSGMPLRVTFFWSRACDNAAVCPGVERVDGRSLQIPGGDYLATYRTLLVALDLARAARE